MNWMPRPLCFCLLDRLASGEEESIFNTLLRVVKAVKEEPEYAATLAALSERLRQAAEKVERAQ